MYQYRYRCIICPLKSINIRLGYSDAVITHFSIKIKSEAISSFFSQSRTTVISVVHHFMWSKILSSWITFQLIKSIFIQIAALTMYLHIALVLLALTVCHVFAAPSHRDSQPFHEGHSNDNTPRDRESHPHFRWKHKVSGWYNYWITIILCTFVTLCFYKSASITPRLL